MAEPSFDERARVSAPGLRTFLNIADRWKLSAGDQVALLQCDARYFEDWSNVARSNGPLVLDTSVLMRLSAILGVFAELRQFLASADEERDWLTDQHKAWPCNGRSPLDLLRGTFDDQLDVRRYAYGVALGESAPNEIDRDFTPYTDGDLIRHDATPRIQAVCFDGFGTVVEITDKRRPFQALLAGSPSSGATAKALSRPTSLRELARDLTSSPDEARLIELEADLEAECASVRPRPGMDAILEALRQLGLKIGVCSNLASAYEHALLGCLPRVPDALVLSFQIGMMKPQIEIYQMVCRQLNLEPNQILFVGDSLEADVLGPRAAGLFAMSIGEFEAALAHRPAPATPRAIAELFERIGDLRQQGRGSLMHSPEQALDSGLARVNVSARRKYARQELLHVLRSPSAVMQGNDAGLKHLLSAFIDETDEALLTRITEGSEITWANLWQAAQAGLRPGDLKLAWIAGRAAMSCGDPPLTPASVAAKPQNDQNR